MMTGDDEELALTRGAMMTGDDEEWSNRVDVGST